MEVILSYECVPLKKFLKNVEVFKMVLRTRKFEILQLIYERTYGASLKYAYHPHIQVGKLKEMF